MGTHGKTINLGVGFWIITRKTWGKHVDFGETLMVFALKHW